VEALRVLIVDDEVEFVNALVERLALRNIQARGVTDGKQALELIQGSEFDVMLLDVKMPGLGGLEIVRKVKESQPNLAVILLSGHSSPQDESLGKQLGCYDYLVKPVKLEDLVRILNSAASQTCEGP
jgi:DNA-binding response OmpR family regulator